MAEPDSPTNVDQRSREQARDLAVRASEARPALAELDQEQVDRIVGAMAATAAEHAVELAAAAVEETGYGVRADKVRKNLFAARTVYDFIRPMKTVGVLRRLDDRGVVEIAEPFGVVAAIAPSTNPTSTAIYKLLIAMKARCPIVISPHPAAVDCINRTVRLLERAARGAGAPAGAIAGMDSVTIAGTQELMRHPRVAVILATGGMGLVRAAYSAGKPAYGVGPGNAPAYIERSADVGKAARDVLTGKTFDNGLLCSSENSVVVDAAIAEEVRRALEAEGGHFLNRNETAALAGVLITPQRLPHPKLVGRTAIEIAGRAGLQVPDRTRALIAPLDGVGRDHPLSIEKLCPVLSFYVVEDWRAGCERCRQILRYGGMGHTMAIHSRGRVGGPRVRAAETGFPHRGEHARNARRHRHDDRPRSVDDARLRRVRRKRHLRQHLAAPSAQRQAAGVRVAHGTPGSRRPRLVRDTGSGCGRRRFGTPGGAGPASGGGPCRRVDGRSERRARAPRSAAGPGGDEAGRRRAADAGTVRLRGRRPGRHPGLAADRDR